MLVGHGLVERQLCGPSSPSSAPKQETVMLRRYRCRSCNAVLVVGPRGLLRRRWYSASAIALALSMVAHHATSRAVRARICPGSVVGSSAVERWATLSRWLKASRQGELFGVRGLSELCRRAVAEQITLALAARAGHRLGDDLGESAYRGAALAA